MEWIKEDESFLSADGVSAYCVSDFEGEFLFADKNRSREMVINCFILAFNVPPVWARKGVQMPDTMNEAAEMLREAGKKLLKDNIDWESRLGELIGSNFG